MYYFMNVVAMHIETPNLPPSKKQFKIEIQEFENETSSDGKSLLDITVNSVSIWVMEAAPVYTIGQESFPTQSGDSLVVQLTVFELEDKQHAIGLIERLNDEYTVTK